MLDLSSQSPATLSRPSYCTLRLFSLRRLELLHLRINSQTRMSLVGNGDRYKPELRSFGAGGIKSILPLYRSTRKGEKQKGICKEKTSYYWKTIKLHATANGKDNDCFTKERWQSKEVWKCRLVNDYSRAKGTRKIVFACAPADATLVCIQTWFL